MGWRRSLGGLGYLANAAANSMGHRNDRRAEGAEGIPVGSIQAATPRVTEMLFWCFFLEITWVYTYIYILYIHHILIVHAPKTRNTYHLQYLRLTFGSFSKCYFPTCLTFKWHYIIVYCIIDLRLLKYVSFLGSFERNNVLVTSMDVQTDNVSGHGQRYDQSGWFFLNNISNIAWEWGTCAVVDTNWRVGTTLYSSSSLLKKTSLEWNHPVFPRFFPIFQVTLTTHVLNGAFLELDVRAGGISKATNDLETTQKLWSPTSTGSKPDSHLPVALPETNMT